ncbi:MAG: DUF302 domain-containing protein [Chromatiales bacterium]|jgi:uncharacterized protein (DUF302 family)
MSVLRNLLALVGLLAVVAAGILAFAAQRILSGFDPQADDVYLGLAKRVIETRSGSEAMIVRMPVEEGLSWQDVEQTMKFVANEHNMSDVGELPLYKDVEAKSGEEYRFVKIYMFCNSLTAAKMMDYSDAYAACLPCRITLLEDLEGRLWLIAMNMDLMIHGGAPLPPDLKADALKVKEVMLDIMSRGARGAF